MAPNDIDHLQALLARVFAFSPADLAVNRMGMMSDAQKTRITQTHSANCQTAWQIFALIFSLGLLGFTAAMISSEYPLMESLFIYFGFTAFWGLIVWAFMVYQRQQIQRTLRQGDVQLVAGQIQLFTERSGRVQHRYFCIGRHKFRLDNYAHFAALQKSGITGREATMYVSSPWRSLLSVLLQA